MAKKKKAAAAAPAAAAPSVDSSSVSVFTPAEAKKIAKLLKAADRGKRLDAIRTVSENHEYITTGGCLLPLLESTVAKKKMEEVVKAAGQVIVDYFIGREGNDVAVASANTLKAMEQAKKKPAKYRIAEVIGNLVLNPDRGNSWNAVRSLRSMAATVVSLPKGSSQSSSLGALLLGCGQTPECLCYFFVKHEKLQSKTGDVASFENAAAVDTVKEGGDIVPWPALRIHALDTLGVMCEVSDSAIQTVVASQAIPLLLSVLRSITASEEPAMPLLTSVILIISAVAKRGSVTSAKSQHAPAVSAALGATGITQTLAPELAALSKGGAWGAVYDALKGPIMARAAELQSGVASGTSGKKTEIVAPAVSVDLARCLDNMARCAEILRVMAMTGAGLQEEGALEAGVAAMSSILGMQGLPREEEEVANLMTEMVKAMGSIACLSEEHRIKVCSAGAAPMVLSLMAPPPSPGIAVNAVAASNLLPPLDSSHGRLMRKTAEKCLHHLLVSRITWMADDRALCDTTTCALAADNESNGNVEETSVGKGKNASTAAMERRNSDANAKENCPSRIAGPAYLTVESVLAAANADSIDVRCRAIRLLSRLVSSRRNAVALGAAAIPVLSRLIAWWLRTRNDPEADRTPRAVETASSERKKRKSTVAKAGGMKKGTAAPPPAAKEEMGAEAEEAMEALRMEAKRLEESDGTRVLRDEALAYTLGVLVQLAESGGGVRAAIGADTVVDLLAKIIKVMPCTPEQFFSDSVTSKPSVTDGEEKNLNNPRKEGVDQSLTVDGKIQASQNVNQSPIEHPPDKPDISLDLTATTSDRYSTPRHKFCWRRAKSRDPTVEVFSPLDWDWDFELSPSHEPTQPGIVLRAVVFRVLITLAEGFDPCADITPQAMASPSAAGGKNGTAAAAALTAGTSAANGADSAHSVLRHTLTVCLDLLSVDVVHDKTDHKTFGGDGGDGDMGGGSEKSPKDDVPHIDGVHVKTTVVTADALLGVPVSPSEELVHEDVRQGCLRLLASLLRMGSVAREGLISAADTHRGGWSQLLIRSCPGKESAATSDVVTEAWKKPETFRCWNFGDTNESSWRSLQAALPYVRAVSALLGPLRNLDAPTTHVMAALVALRRLCAEGEHEPGGAKPESSPEGEPPLPTSRHGTTGALVDTIAGVAVGVGAVVPLVSIWGCAAAAAGEGTLPSETVGMVDECQGLIDYLIRRGHAREAYWSSLPSVKPSPSALSNKTQSKSAKAQAKKGKGGTKDGQDLVSAAATKSDTVHEAVPPPPPPLGRDDPNLGPNRTTWASLLNARVDDQRTQTSATTALLMATIMGLETGIGNLLVAGVDPNVRGTDGRTPLMCALAQGMDEAVRGLVDAGADVDAVDLHGSSVLKAAFLCPPRWIMRNIMRRRRSDSITAMAAAAAAGEEAAAALALGGAADFTSVGSTRRVSTTRTDHSTDSTATGRPRSRSRSGSVDVGRSRSRPGSLTMVGRRKSSLGRAVSFSEVDDGVASGAAASLNDRRRRFSRTSSMSAVDSARAALRAAARTEHAGPLKTPRGTLVVQGDARMVRYILACGADPNVSGGEGDFPLHWATTGTELTVRIMNQCVRIVTGTGNGTGNGTGSGTGSGTTSTVSDEGTITNHQMSSGASDKSSIVNLAAAGGSESCELVDDLTLLKVLVNAGSSLDACNPEGMTALHCAVIVDRPDLAGVLLDAGASPNVSDSLGCLPLHYACLCATAGYHELAERLLALAMGRPLNKGVFQDHRKGRTRREKLLLDVGEIMRSGLREATEPSSITQHRATRPELLNHVSAEGFAPLHYACDGRITAERRAAASILARLKRRLCVLHASPVSSTLVDRRPSSNGGAGDDGSRQGRTLKDSMLAPDRVHILRWLLSEPELDPRVRTPRGATALHLAAQLHEESQGTELTRMLVRTGINIDALDAPPPSTATSDDRGSSLARNVCGSPHRGASYEGSSCLASDEGRTRDTYTPSIGAGLDRTGGGGGGGTVRDSSESGDGDPTPVEQEFFMQFSALHYALQTGSWGIADALLSAGANVRPERALPPCVHVACHAGAPASLVLKLLARKKSEPEPTTIAGDQPRVLWGDLGVPAIISPNEKTCCPYYAATSLFLAAGSGSAELVTLLLPKYEDAVTHSSSNVTVKDARDAAAASVSLRGDVWSMKHSPMDGRNPLHAAAVGGHTAVARVLLDAGGARPWINAKDYTGRTPLGLAVDWGKWRLAAVLAANDEFDVRLAIDDGKTSALLCTERANMAIVDEGSGEASALSALRDSNTLLLTLLQKLGKAAAREAAAAALHQAGEAALALARTQTEESRERLHDAAVRQGVETQQEEEAGSTSANAGGTVSGRDEQESRPEGGAEKRAGGAGASEQLRSKVVERLEALEHLHPCFAKGVLYSNAKGVSFPNSRLSSDEGRAVLIIEKSARDARTRRESAERNNARVARRRGSVSGMGG